MPHDERYQSLRVPCITNNSSGSLRAAVVAVRAGFSLADARWWAHIHATDVLRC